MARTHEDEVRFLVAVRVDGRAAFGDDPVDAVSREIAAHHLAGRSIDGALLGVPGWVFAALLGDADDGTLLRLDVEREASLFDLPASELRSRLEDVFGEVQVAPEISADGHVVVEDGLFALGPEWSGVAVAEHGQLYLHASAAGVGTTLVATTVGAHDVIGRLDRPSDDELVVDVSGSLLGVGSGARRKPVVVLWRRGAMTGLQLMRKGDIVDVHIWEPSWREIRPTGILHPLLDEVVGDVIEALQPMRSEGEALVKAYGLDGEATINLRALLRRPVPDVAGLMRLLGLPEEAAAVLACTTTVAELPGAVVYEPAPLREVMKREMATSSPSDPRWVRVFEAAARDQAWWYVASNVLFLLVCIGFVWDWQRNDGSAWFGVVGVVLGIGTALDLVVRQLLLRRRVAARR